MNRSAQFLAWALAIATAASSAQQRSRITAAQLSQMLQQARGEKDSSVARQLSTLQLTERPDTATLALWQSESQGKQTRLALAGLADASAFLDPPPSGILSLTQPDRRELRQIFLRASDYVKQSVPRLPDFYALRTTTYFVETPPRAPNWPGFCKSPKRPALGTGCFTIGAANPYPGQPGIGLVRLTGEGTETITYLHGAELLDSPQADPLSPLEFLDLVTSGEFGPLLTVVLDDALHGEVTWGLWEQGANGPLAVVRYRVPQTSSHYTVDYSFPLNHSSVQSAYHGEIAIDAATGTIWRITVIDEPDPQRQDLSTAVMLEYGPVTIGGISYICPIRGVAWSKAPVFTRHKGKAVQLPFTQTQLDEFRFTGYHRFRGDVQILPESAGNSPTKPTSSISDIEHKSAPDRQQAISPAGQACPAASCPSDSARSSGSIPAAVPAAHTRANHSE